MVLELVSRGPRRCSGAFVCPRCLVFRHNGYVPFKLCRKCSYELSDERNRNYNRLRRLRILNESKVFLK